VLLLVLGGYGLKQGADPGSRRPDVLRRSGAGASGRSFRPVPRRGRRGGVAGIASVASSEEGDPTVTSRARRHPREAVGLKVLSNRGGTISAPSGVLHTPHCRPPEKRPHRLRSLPSKMAARQWERELPSASGEGAKPRQLWKNKNKITVDGGIADATGAGGAGEASKLGQDVRTGFRILGVRVGCGISGSYGRA